MKLNLPISWFRNKITAENDIEEVTVGIDKDVCFVGAVSEKGLTSEAYSRLDELESEFGDLILDLAWSKKDLLEVEDIDEAYFEAARQISSDELVNFILKKLKEYDSLESSYESMNCSLSDYQKGKKRGFLEVLRDFYYEAYSEYINGRITAR